jgi:GAF domain-containing protein/HAMP domain-containing protein
MSSESNTPAMSKRRFASRVGRWRARLADVPVRVKLYIGLGVLTTGLILIGFVTTYTSFAAQRLVQRDLTHQRRLADLAAEINNNLLDVQNRAYEFYFAWNSHGFERGVGTTGFDRARDTYLVPIGRQLEQIRADIAEIGELQRDPETLAALEKTQATIEAYESTLAIMSGHMEGLGYRSTGELGTVNQIVSKLDSSFDKAGLPSLQAVLLQSDQYVKNYFLTSNLGSVRLAREFMHQIAGQVADMSDVKLWPADRTELLDLLDQYDTHFLAAVSEHRKLQDAQPSLSSQSALASGLVTTLFTQQQARFDAAVDHLQSQQSRMISVTIALVLVTLMGTPAIAYLVTRQVIRPILALGQAAAQLGVGDLDVRAAVHGGDEIGTTARAFNLMAERLQASLTGLEERVAERTRDLEATTVELAARSADLEKAHHTQMEINRQLEETVQQSQRRARLLQASAEVSRAAARLRDLDTLLPEVTRSISQHFGFYHVGIFLLDEAQRYALLKAANSEGGQRMLARGHKLAVGTTGIVGNVTRTGQPRIAHDVGADAHFFNNPDLPETHSEMALPLRIGGEIVGALDVQSTAKAAFGQEDIAVLTALADQVAIAIQNARLFRQSERALEEAQLAHRRYLQQQWSEYLWHSAPLTYEYALSGAPAAAEPPTPIVERAWQEGQVVAADTNGNHDDAARSVPRAVLAAPIQVHGETIGVLDLEELDTDRTWTEDEIVLVQTIADQLGQAVEQARLFEQTQTSLAETRTLFQTSRSLAAAQEMEEIWQAVIDASRQRGADACALFLFDRGEDAAPGELVLVTGWDANYHPPRLPRGTRLALHDSGLPETMHPNQPWRVDDVNNASSLDDGVRGWLRSSDFAAALYQPIAVRGQWYGLLLILYSVPHAFVEAETEFYRTLADQAALAFESQRLLEEAQRRAEREQLIRQITDKVRATSSLETILESTVQELSRAMGVPRAFIRLGTETGSSQDHHLRVTDADESET